MTADSTKETSERRRPLFPREEVLFLLPFASWIPKNMGWVGTALTCLLRARQVPSSNGGYNCSLLQIYLISPSHYTQTLKCLAAYRALQFFFFFWLQGNQTVKAPISSNLWQFLCSLTFRLNNVSMNSVDSVSVLWRAQGRTPLSLPSEYRFLNKVICWIIYCMAQSPWNVISSQFVKIFSYVYEIQISTECCPEPDEPSTHRQAKFR